MSNNKQDQTARRRATQDVIAANRALFEERMQHYYTEMGLGTWSPRLSAEERAAVKAEQAKQAAAEKIKALAEAAGIGVLLVDDPLIEDKIKATQDGTAKGVTVDWDRPAAEQPYRDEEAETIAEYESGEDEEALAEQRRRDEDEDAAENVAQASQF